MRSLSSGAHSRDPLWHRRENHEAPVLASGRRPSRRLLAQAAFVVERK